MRRTSFVDSLMRHRAASEAPRHHDDVDDVDDETEAAVDVDVDVDADVTAIGAIIDDGSYSSSLLNA